MQLLGGPPTHPHTSEGNTLLAANLSGGRRQDTHYFEGAKVIWTSKLKLDFGAKQLPWLNLARMKFWRQHSPPKQLVSSIKQSNNRHQPSFSRLFPSSQRARVVSSRWIPPKLACILRRGGSPQHTYIGHESVVQLMLALHHMAHHNLHS